MTLVIVVLRSLRQEDHDLGLCNKPKNKSKKTPPPKKTRQRFESVLRKMDMCAGDVAQVLECLPSKQEALSSKKFKVTLGYVVTWRSSLGYMRPCVS